MTWDVAVIITVIETLTLAVSQTVAVTQNVALTKTVAVTQTVSVTLNVNCMRHEQVQFGDCRHRVKKIIALNGVDSYIGYSR